MVDMYRKLTLRKRIWILIALAGVAAVILIAVGLSIPIRSETLKAKVIALLTEELESEVTIEKLEGRVFPRVAVSGSGVVIRQKGRTDVPPLITIETFEIRGSLRDLMKEPRRVAEVRIKGLQVKIPPGDDVERGDRQTDAEAHAQAQKLQHVIIERFEAPDTVITLIPKRAGKQPKVFTVHHLTMDSLGINETIPYIATLTNPVPKGEIETSGTFGPWNVTSPASTPVTGRYNFDNANLDTIDGLAGVLSSTGEFKGPLNRIEIHGTTDTPKFQVDAGGLPVPLKTRFTAIVDGSDGDTYLNQVDATFLNTSMTAKGAVIGLEGVHGRQIEVDVDMQNGRIEDLLRLAVNSEKPILLGAARLQAKLVIPPEKKKVIDKLQLRGGFVLYESDVHRSDGAEQAHRPQPARSGDGPGRSDRGRPVEPEGHLCRRAYDRQFFQPHVFGAGRSRRACRPVRSAQRADRFSRSSEDAGAAVGGRRRRREGLLSEGVRSVLQETRRGDGAADQDCGHAEGAQVRPRYVLNSFQSSVFSCQLLRTSELRTEN